MKIFVFLMICVYSIHYKEVYAKYIGNKIITKYILHLNKKIARYKDTRPYT